MSTTKTLPLQQQLLLLLLLFIYPSSAQTAGDCPATDAACRCDGDSIICEDLGQRQMIPSFSSSSTVFSSLSFQGDTTISGIQSRAFAGLRVGTIDVSGTGLMSMDPAAFEDSNTTELNLSCNLLRQLPDGLFINQTTIETIDLSGNNLTITSETFRGLTSLTRLFLSGNSICTISSSLFSLSLIHI